jgi:hypothetical protein
MLSENDFYENKGLEKKFLKTETFMAKNGYMMEHDVYELSLKEPQTDNYGNFLPVGYVMGTTCSEPKYCGKFHDGLNRKQRRTNLSRKQYKNSAMNKKK